MLYFFGHGACDVKSNLVVTFFEHLGVYGFINDNGWMNEHWSLDYKDKLIPNSWEQLAVC